MSTLRGINRRLAGYALVLTAAVLWATLGLFYRALATTYGLPLPTIVFFRALVAALSLFVVLGWRRQLRLEKRDWLYFAAYGLFGVAAFFMVYIYAIDLSGMGVAAVLMYTAPAWVTLFGALFLHEPITWQRGVALALSFAGCALVSRAYDLSQARFNLLGILAGVGAGITYGSYVLFSKAAQRRYTPWTTLAYALGFGALFMLPWQSPPTLWRAVTTPGSLVWILLLGWIPTIGAGIAFNAGLRWVPAGDASIVATLEPVVATLLGWLVLSEHLELPQVAGAALVLVAVVSLQRGAASMTADVDHEEHKGHKGHEGFA